jgi:hypothetical protein
MSSGVEVPGSQRRPGIWSYFSFSGPRRRVSVSLPRDFTVERESDDPYEKHRRNQSANENGFMTDYKGGAVMNQGQKVRYLKTGGIIAFILLVLYFIAPRDGLSRGRQQQLTVGTRADSMSSDTAFRRQHSRWRRKGDMHKVFLERQASHSIRIDDRRRKHRISHSRLQV